MTSVYDDGSLYFCCPALLGISPGNLREQTLEEAWNSPWAQRIRQTILDGSYKYCSEVNCPRLQPGSDLLFDNEEVTDPYFRKIIDEQLTELPRGPQHISVAYDPTCNLSCPSCRTEMYRCGNAEREEIAKIHRHLFGGDLSDLRLITMATNGDPFASPFYLSTLREFDWAAHPKLKIEFITNGLRLTPKMWASVANCHGAIQSLRVSMNAACAKTFAINQRGGQLADLLPNLRYLAEQRRAGVFPSFMLSFYVLENNFREMKEFVALSKDLGVDEILFHHYLKGSSVADPEFDASAVHLPTHPDHDEFRALLEDPIFDDPTIRLSNLRYIRGASEPHVINAAGKFAPDKLQVREMSWEECRDFLLLEEPAATEFRALIDELKRAAATLFSRPQADGPSPIEVLLGAESAAGQGHAGFVKLVQVGRPAGESQTYGELLAALDAAFHPRFVALVPVRHIGAFVALPVASLRDINTGIDALGEVIERVRDKNLSVV